MSTSTASRRAGVASTVISLVAAILSSACCWAPLLALGLGTSAAGFAGTFAPLRPYFLGIAVLSLGVSAYLLFIKPRRAESCKEGSACATPRPNLRRFQVGMFAVSVLMVGGFAFFPSYVGAFLGDPNAAPINEAAETATNEPIVLWQVDGMTCKSCASALAETLTELEGVHAAKVDFDAGVARVQVAMPPPDDAEGAGDAVDLDAQIESILTENGFTGHILP